MKNNAADVPDRPKPHHPIQRIHPTTNAFPVHHRSDEADRNENPHYWKVHWANLQYLSSSDISRSEQKRKRRLIPRQTKKQDRGDNREEDPAKIHTRLRIARKLAPETT